MRIAVALVLTVVLGAQNPAPLETPANKPGPAPTGPTPVGTMKELMLDLIFHTSNEIFYVSRTDTKTEAQWIDLQKNALSLAESANELLSPERRYDNDQWMRDAQLLWEVANKAYKFAKAKDQKGLEGLNDELYEACQSCHVRYRPGYRRRL